MHYKKHVFFCVQQKRENKKCCQQGDAENHCFYMKKRIKELGLDGIRVGAAGCLGRCKLGPCLVIYPEGVWYTYKDTQDLDTIIEKHLLNDEIVTELMLGQINEDES